MFENLKQKKYFKKANFKKRFLNLQSYNIFFFFYKNSYFMFH